MKSIDTIAALMDLARLLEFELHLQARYQAPETNTLMATGVLQSLEEWQPS